jgi:hypothetical protein
MEFIRFKLGLELRFAVEAPAPPPTGTLFFGLLGLAPAYVVCFKNSEADSSLSTFCAPSLVVG